VEPLYAMRSGCEECLRQHGNFTKNQSEPLFSSHVDNGLRKRFALDLDQFPVPKNRMFAVPLDNSATRQFPKPPGLALALSGRGQECDLLTVFGDRDGFSLFDPL